MNGLVLVGQVGLYDRQDVEKFTGAFNKTRDELVTEIKERLPEVQIYDLDEFSYAYNNEEFPDMYYWIAIATHI